MIITKNDLRRYLSADAKQMKPNHAFIQKRLFSEDSDKWELVKGIRYLEYYTNNSKWCFSIFRIFYELKVRRLRKKTNMYIYPNIFDEGLHIVHPGFIYINFDTHIGKNCTILPMVLIGKKRPGTVSDIYVGDNCYIGTGAMIFGPVKIGNNVTIAAGAVVINDIPDNSVVAGIPAIVVKTENIK